jgi:ribonuclease R/exosome complex exonuclease DIS3/RRP44
MKKKFKKFNKRKQKDFSNKILKLLQANPKKAYNYKQIASELELEDAKSRNTIIKNLADLAAKQEIKEKERGRYQISKSNDYREGTLEITRNGAGFVLVDDLEHDIFIPKNYLNHALDGDTVEVYIYRAKPGRKPQGEINKVIKRFKRRFVGTVRMSKNFAFVVPDNEKVYADFFISQNKMGDAKDGDKVVVKLLDWPANANSPFGAINQVLGQPGMHDTEIHSILAEYELPYEFTEEIEAEANELSKEIDKAEIAKRRDMRNITTFTIDPVDAKDFDDALSFEILENGNYEIGIHIADVSHYLKRGTALDDEAYRRATSVYLVDRVVPMLPEVLSNGVCSLRPNEEKFTFSAVFEMDDTAKIIKQWFGRTVTYSDRRFAYEEAQEVIETGVGDYAKEILTMDKLAKIMRKKRMESGAISFDKSEVRFKLDKDANPIDVYFKTSQDANKLIEEFMLLANKKVAEFIGKQQPKKTFVYRIHDQPKEDRVLDLKQVIANFGYKINTKNSKELAQSLNKLLQDIKGKPEENLIATLVIRTMSKAIYSTANIGHYGLAFDYYSHFTSPIRRYPDVMVHRLLQHYLDGGNTVSEQDYEKKCKHSSEREQLATRAERDSIKYMQVKYMQEHQNETFIGVISGVTEWGVYVEIIANKCEGMIRTRDITDDYFVYEAKNHAIVGQVSKVKYQLGDEVRVKVRGADLKRKQLDFYLLGKAED